MMINIGNFNEQKVTLKFILIQITTERERCNTLPMEKECARLPYVLVKKGPSYQHVHKHINTSSIIHSALGNSFFGEQ